MENITNNGTQAKFAISLSLPNGLSMEDVDFTATFFVNRGYSVSVSKETMQQQDDGTYTAIVDTAQMGSGLVKCQIEALLPDSQIAGGLRKEIVTVVTTEEVRNGLH